MILLQSLNHIFIQSLLQKSSFSFHCVVLFFLQAFLLLDRFSIIFFLLLFHCFYTTAHLQDSLLFHEIELQKITCEKNTNTILPIVGIIVKEWCDYIPVLEIYSIGATLGLDFFSSWKIICKRLSHNCISIDGFTNPLPVVYIFLLSKILIQKCSIKILSAPFSLVVSTSSNMRCDSSWKNIRGKFHKLILALELQFFTSYTPYIE